MTAWVDSIDRVSALSATHVDTGRLEMSVHAAPAGTKSTMFRMNWLLPNGSLAKARSPALDQSARFSRSMVRGMPSRKSVTEMINATLASPANHEPCDREGNR